MFALVKSPWLDIPLTEYEGHMALLQVAQAQLLSDLFADALRQYRPRSVAVLGCAGGNGFERIPTTATPRVVGVDLNPAYVQQAHLRFAGRIPQLELYVGDVQTDVFGFAPVELLFAGLLFEYVEIDAALRQMRGMLVSGGTLLSVVQLPCGTAQMITPSPYTSLAALAPIMRLVAPEALERMAAAHGFRQFAAHTATAAGGKQFGVQALRLEKAGKSQPERVAARSGAGPATECGAG